MNNITVTLFGTICIKVWHVNISYYSPRRVIQYVHMPNINIHIVPNKVTVYMLQLMYKLPYSNVH